MNKESVGEKVGKLIGWVLAGSVAFLALSVVLALISLIWRVIL